AKDRTARVLDHLVRHAAQEPAREALPAAGGPYRQVGPSPLEHGKHGEVGEHMTADVAFVHDDLVRDRETARAAAELLSHPAAPAPAHVVLVAARGPVGIAR